MRRFMIAGTKSGSGKTTVTCAVLAALKAKGLKAASFKCGPDYIDPMFHREVLGADAHNLDSFFCDEDTLCYLLQKGSKNADISVIEGVMGFYDGNAGSAHTVSAITRTPVILVIDCKGMSDSIGALMQGFLNYRRPNNIAGFIFDRLPLSYTGFAKKLCEENNTQYFGCLPQMPFTFESRHLGLVTAAETEDIKEKLESLKKTAEENILIDKLIEIQAPSFSENRPFDLPYFKGGPVIALASDRAFCFRYAENIELLEELGCRIEYFSPLEDEKLPKTDGLILCGGYPEIYAEKLSKNKSLLSDIQKKAADGMPIIAECGGFLYLHETLQTKTGETFKMAGVIPGKAFPTDRLQRFGYINMNAQTDGMLLKTGETLKAHEFHYWESTNCGNAFTAVKQDGRSWQCGHSSANIYAGFPHLYFYSDKITAVRFVTACAEYGEHNEKDRTDITAR